MVVEKVQSQWAARRESYNRLGSGRKLRRVRDRRDMTGTPAIRETRRDYGEFMYKGTEVRPLPKSNVSVRFARNVKAAMPGFETAQYVGEAPHVAKRFAAQLRKDVTDSILKEFIRALNVVRERAEKQLGYKIERSGRETKYVRELQMWVARNVEQSSVGWEEELRGAIQKARPHEVFKVLIDKEYTAKQQALSASRTLLGGVYNDYTVYLLKQDKQVRVRWINPNDKRTTPTCRALMALTAKGVSIDEMYRMVKEHAAPGFYTPKNPYLPHFQCRSAIVVV